MLNEKNVFLASSSELKEDREQFELLINRKNKEWVKRGVFLKLIEWEDFLDAMSKTRLQDEYNKAIRGCDIFVMLFCTKVGQYTEEEFETAFGQFKTTNKPFIFTYFKDAQINISTANETDLMSLLAFKKKLGGLGHFYTAYKNIDQLKFHFNQQLDKLAENGFVELNSGASNSPHADASSYQATLSGSGAIAQGKGATAVSERGVSIGGNSTGDIITGTQITTGAVSGSGIAFGDGAQIAVTRGLSSAELNRLFAPLLETVINQVPAAQQASALRQVEELKTEVAKGKQADDSKIGKLVDGLIALVPSAIGSVAGIFSTPILAGIAGPVTKFVLDKLKLA